MIKFRKVELNTPGSFFLHSMPGLKEPFEVCCQQLETASVKRVICLNPIHEVREKSPDYATAIQNESIPFDWVHFPIGNQGVPEDKKAFMELAEQTAQQLKEGDNILVHCKGGVGRTGTFACCVTALLNQPLSRVSDAGGKAETEQQRKLIAALQHL